MKNFDGIKLSANIGLPSQFDPHSEPAHKSIILVQNHYLWQNFRMPSIISKYLGRLALLALVALSLSSCETDVDLLAPYKTTPVIYGILDARADTQFVRINRTFLAEGDLKQYAQIKDSVEYDPSEVDAWLIKRQNGTKVDSIQLSYIERSMREEGAFYNQNVGFYYTAEPLLTDDQLFETNQTSSAGKWTYDLRATIRGVAYTATTDFPSLDEGDISFPAFPVNNVFTKAVFYQASSSSYRTLAFRYSRASTSFRYQGLMRLNYEYYLTDGSVVAGQEFDFPLGVAINPEGVNDSRDQSFNFSSVNWYEQLGEELRAIPNLEKIRLVDLEFRLSAANETFNRFINIAQPTSEFTPVFGSFSNFDRGAIGVLASRSTLARKFLLEDPSVTIMTEGEFTSGYCYCVDNWVGSALVCTDSPNGCP